MKTEDEENNKRRKGGREEEDEGRDKKTELLFSMSSPYLCCSEDHCSRKEFHEDVELCGVYETHDAD